ncbi:MAG: hypothetical protein KHX48_11345, partial [Alistipes sp.]|nr:hypothetical protein [Alistipes sp.]
PHRSRLFKGALLNVLRGENRFGFRGQLTLDFPNVYIPNGGRIYRYWKCRPLLQVSDNDEHFSHFTEDERLF